jgi:hypothetical protein
MSVAELTGTIGTWTTYAMIFQIKSVAAAASPGGLLLQGCCREESFKRQLVMRMENL